MIYMEVRLFSSWPYWSNILSLIGAISRGLGKNKNTANTKQGTSSSPFSILMIRTQFTQVSGYQMRGGQNILCLQRLPKGFLEVLCSSEHLCEHCASQTCPPSADHQLLGGCQHRDMWRAAEGESSLGCASMGRVCTAGSLRTLNPLQWPQTPFSIKRQGGREREQGRKKR